MSNKDIRKQIADIQKGLEDIDRLSVGQKRTLAKQAVRLVKECPELDTPIFTKMLIMAQRSWNNQDPSFAGEFGQGLRNLIENPKISLYKRICLAQVSGNTDRLFVFAKSGDGASRFAVKALGALGAKQKLRELLMDEKLPDHTRIESALELAKSGDVQRGEIENLIGCISFWSQHSQALMELANAIEQKFPDLAISLLRKLWDCAPLSRPEIIAALKRLKASDHLIEIVKSYKSLLAESDSANEITISLYNALDDVNVKVNQLDQALVALFELGDQQALTEIVNDTMIAPYLRKQAEQYLTTLKAG